MLSVAWRYGKALLFVLLLSAGAYGVLFVLAEYWPSLGIYAQSTLVFFVTKVAGDALRFVFYRSGQPAFGEDFIRELVVFSVVGLVAGAAIGLAVRVVGGPVTPALPAVGGYLVYGIASGEGKGLG